MIVVCAKSEYTKQKNHNANSYRSFLITANEKSAGVKVLMLIDELSGT
jgi:hypothetical protein